MNLKNKLSEIKNKIQQNAPIVIGVVATSAISAAIASAYIHHLKKGFHHLRKYDGLDPVFFLQLTEKDFQTMRNGITIGEFTDYGLLGITIQDDPED